MKGTSHTPAVKTNSALSPIEEIIEEMQNGRMVVLVDAEDRENEGDLVIPAQMATPDAINFMARYGRGLICLTLTQTRAAELRLQSQARPGVGRATAFTQSIEARDGITTGISAFDRSRTISTAIDASKGAADIVSPGHVFPLIAREGGVLVRAGHTEASVDLARLAGLFPSAVICEIMNDDGTMARMPDLVPFAKQHGLKIGAIEDLIAYRLKNDRIVRPVARIGVETSIAGAFDMHVYQTTVEPTEHVALVKGNIHKGGPVLVRVQPVNLLNDVLGITGAAGGVGDSGTAIEQSMRAIETEGRGVVVLIRDLRARSLSEWVTRQSEASGAHDTGKDRRQVDIGIGSQILADLGITDMVLLTTSPQHVYVGLEAFGLRVTGTRKIE
ncbi:MAG: 3,4-dihydroxy-2-butanone-4-phosphate synthase [Hyphomicrobium sp.]|nr:3,4-dihydroxy-2-butanone-4-phosphate synthase [Hyphomicrobium sp.]